MNSIPFPKPIVPRSNMLSASDFISVFVPPVLTDSSRLCIGGGGTSTSPNATIWITANVCLATHYSFDIRLYCKDSPTFVIED